ncbi:MAG: Rid family detoxifying hydrolase [Candidatus Levybacteria bacterium]|nr:Rid family detoxifying hydrolase [Candidatus Levybacteria bacterium]
MKKFISTTSAPKAVGPYSQAVLTDNILFCSGQVAIDPATGTIDVYTIEEQTERVISNLSAVLKKAGLSIKDVVQAQCFLTDMGEYQKFNEVYGKHFSKSKPARFTVEVSELPLEAKVEISCIATKSS